MRFIVNGPSIPDELLTARDEGRVIFFCGAGVSRARARLPDFFGLAKAVMEDLHAAADSEARRLIDAMPEIASKVGVTGLIAVDTVFGLLEREFSTQDINRAVAKALRPPVDVDLMPHRVLLDLSRGPDRKVRLVTTNFDLLFEVAGARLDSWARPVLPDPHRHDDFSGIIHLHGRVTDAYDGAVGDGFVLSSAEFGGTYLAEAWSWSGCCLQGRRDGTA